MRTNWFQNAISLNDIVDAASVLYTITAKFRTLHFEHFPTSGCADCTVLVSMSLHALDIIAFIRIYSYLPILIPLSHSLLQLVGHKAWV